MTHICISILSIIGSDNGLSSGQRQAIIWTSAGILLIGPLGTNFSEILIEIHTFSLKKMHLKMSAAKCRPFCLGLNMLMRSAFTTYTMIYVHGFVVYYLNSLQPNNAIWWHKLHSTLVQVIACYPMASSHYLNQYWLIISKVQWHSHEGYFKRHTSTIKHSN